MFFWKETYSETLVEIVEDFVDNNNGKPWKSLGDFACFGCFFIFANFHFSLSLFFLFGFSSFFSLFIFSFFVFSFAFLFLFP